MDQNFGPARFSSATRQRSSSYDRTGGNCDHWRLHPGEQRTLLETTGPGCIRHIWFTVGSGDPLHLRNMVLRAWWDDEPTPSVLCPLGDFFGQAHAVYSLFDTPWLGASSKGGRALNCFFPMPFASAARITIENQADAGVPAYFYFYIDYETGQTLPDNVGRFHAHWRRECLTRPDADLANLTGEGNFLIADINGRGQYIGTILSEDSPSPVWNGEGDDMFFIDNEPWPPRLHGTGTEDYVNTAWCPREKWNGYHHGVILAAHPHGVPFLGKSTYYRFHTADPVQFRQSLRLSIEHGTGNEFVGDWSATSFWYALDRKSPLPDLPTPRQRAPLPALAVEAGGTIEQAHKSLSYFFQAGAPEIGNQLIDQLESQWRGGTFDPSAALVWNANVWSALESVRQKYLHRAGKIVHLKKGAEAELLIDRIHGSHTAAPRWGRVWIKYDDRALHIRGQFQIARQEKPGYGYDKIDFLLAPQDWPEAFLMLSVSPDVPRLNIEKHEANNRAPWNSMISTQHDEIPVKIAVNEDNWRFEFEAPWTDLGLASPAPGAVFSMNIDRWNHAGGAWWASWAITPHHFYPAQLGGLVIFD